MSSWTLGDIAACLGAPSGQYSPETEISGISTDSRTLLRGSLFVPLSGENFDGHNYAESAVKGAGARALVWARGDVPEWLAGYPETVLFRVDDALAAYQALGLYWKKKCGVRCVAVTGSVGKTTTKEFLSHFLGTQFRVHKSQANFNNDIGVPKTLLELKPQHELVVVEMGMRGRGEIARLAKAAEPDVGVITAIGTSHLELLGSREEIALAKGELLEALPPEGRAVLPYCDDFYVTLVKLSQAPVLAYSAEPNQDGVLSPEEIVSEDPSGTSFRFAGREHRLGLPGRHHLHDFFATLAVGESMGVPLEKMLDALPSLSNPDGRAEWLELGGAKFFMDAYNSAPESLRASLQVLQSCQSRRLAVLGDMLELGPEGARIHFEMGRALSEYKVDLALCYGPLSQKLMEGAKESGVTAFWFAEKSELTDYLERELRPGDSVLVKASRGMALETVINAIKERVG